jgi:hypothetical protein
VSETVGSERVDTASSDHDSDNSETRFAESSPIRFSHSRRFAGSWHLKSVVLECEVLLLQIRFRIRHFNRDHPGDILRGLRAEVRDLLRALDAKVVEAKGIIEHRRGGNS